MIGNLADIWTNIEKFEDFRLSKNKDGENSYIPPFSDINEYVKMHLFPLNTNPYTTTLLNYAVQKLRGKFSPPGNPNLLQIPMLYERLLIQECIMNP